MALTAALLGATLLLGACTGSAAQEGAGSPPPNAPSIPTVEVEASASSQVLTGSTATELSLQASQAVFRSSPVVVSVTQEAHLTHAAEQATALSVPLLVLPQPQEAGRSAAEESADASASPDSSAGDGSSPSPDPIALELARLGTTHVLHVGPSAGEMPGVEVVTDPSDLPEFETGQPLDSAAAVTAPDAATAGSRAALATLTAAGAQTLELQGTDPRVDPDDVAAVAARAPRTAIGVGAGFGDDAVFGQRIEAAATGVQLPGGGQTIFADKRYVALYGHPLTGALGVLGEQGPKASVTRARRVAAEYEDLAQESIVPAFEIIATVAAGSAGKDGDYSREWEIEVLRPLVEAAARAGIYVVLDLQSGRSDFLSQATLYEELLREPHVGLALDPEWRLTGDQKPLRQIGSVTAAEINETMDWLADLTDEYDLPQKMVLLHQFRASMITDRDDLDLGHDELAVIVQMDGDGTLGQKLDTWRALRAGAPRALRFGWKNFYDEDEPTPSPATTFGIDPTPWWVSYQ